MLKALRVKNFVLIDSLHYDVAPGLTTITGETGSGKSVLLGALGLVLGDRADGQQLRDPEAKGVIEAVFDIRPYGLEDWFARNNFDFEGESIFRRELLPGGKSRAFINDTPATLNQLRELSESLIDIHSQHETLALQQASFQLTVVDAVSGNQSQLTDWQNLYRRQVALSKQVIRLEEDLRQMVLERDFRNFQAEELREAHLDKLDAAALEQEMQTLEHSEEIAQLLTAVTNELDAEQTGVLERMKRVRQALGKMSAYSDDARELLDRLNSTYLELQEASRESAQLLEGAIPDPERLQLVQLQLNALYALEKKHNRTGPEALLNLLAELEAGEFAIAETEQKLDQARSELNRLHPELKAAQKALTASRQKNLPKLQQEVANLLRTLGMPDAQFEVQLQPRTEPDETGADTALFLFSANPGMPLSELRKVASGGELSRLMLSLKAVLSRKKALPTLIFDEIDTGVSGEVAGRMARVLREMAEHMQVICITHLPQVAACGHHHIKVFKEGRQKPVTRLHVLSATERELEIAQMLSGVETSAAAMENARDLLKSQQ